MRGTAIVGAGFAAGMHVEALKRLGYHITGVLGCDDAESESFRAAHGLPKAYKSYQEVLDDTDVIAVHIVTPNRLHFDMCKRALEAGKHVICEKPLAMTSAESKELVEIAEKSDLVAAVFYQTRFYPLNLEAKDIRERGDLGNVYSVNGSFVQDWLFYDTDYNWRVLSEEGGKLRAIADIGTHWIDLILNITGLEVQHVFADLRTVHNARNRPTGEVETFTTESDDDIERESIDIETEDQGVVLFKFKGGAQGVLWVSQVTAGVKCAERYEIAGSNCSLSWNSKNPNNLHIGHRDRANEVLIRDPSLMSDAASAHTTYPGDHNEGFPDAFKHCVKEVYDAIEAGSDDDVVRQFATFADAHHEIVLCEKILQSAATKRWVVI
ncbi:Gfo/Idh/MocA family oxidoreductase [Candidatus Peribacteria bacterium]|jgi:predicted dehydrogenase|nr:Gfo/Idh/MocA family oxidoreductase [Candidatus Peribacteria bacterium]MBT4021484.1 Gfo/Idh/MocA family oxidoreductase [Candidatus Peribacteria bacterium]MBT4240394.1 Gfo/Idh/MocA family oxidoreductase [Candidatus Peribacteria bacterium]MBT4473817.1 Gfo/Idh/MocA family oxidoreductase [Candidatus Peribacteria bacterium]